MNHLEYLIRQHNNFIHHANRFLDAGAAMVRVKLLIDASPSFKQTYFSGRIHMSDGGNALVLNVDRIHDVSEIKIGLEERVETKKPEYGNTRKHVNYFFVTCTTLVETESGETITLPMIEKRGLTNAVDVLMTAVAFRKSLLDSPDAPRTRTTAISHTTHEELPGSGYKPLKTPIQLRLDLETVANKTKDFYLHFKQHGDSYTTVAFSEPYVCVTMEPNEETQTIKVSYQSGARGAPDTEIKSKFWNIDADIAKKALLLISVLTRKHIDTDEKKKACLISLLASRKKYIAYSHTVKHIGASVNIRNGKASAKIQYKDDTERPSFVFELTYKGETKKYNCFHPSRVLWVIDATNEDIGWKNILNK